ncbi:putative CD63 antigen [Apostichopus japonicus]|uniref:Putative CD63 antigen n=1 Tax=Stichopus japonicus TaxID=307972 RepID=A0A2G8K5Z9_STIJA|nr:putative CD63 antigen [Apostichopus japonicus]
MLCGCALLGLGLYLCFEPSMRSYAHTSGDLQEYYIALYCLIGIGGLMMLVGFLGCCGACAESRILLGMFFTFLLLICVVEVGGGFYAYLQREELKVLVTDSMTQTIKDVYGEDQVVNEAVDSMQQGQAILIGLLLCCLWHELLKGQDKSLLLFLSSEELTEAGRQSPNFNTTFHEKNPRQTAGVLWSIWTRDWLASKYSNIPESCCIAESCTPPSAVEALSKLFAGDTNVIIYTEGCSSKLFKKLEQHTVILAGLTIGIGVVQLLGMVFSCCLCVAIGRQDREQQYI